MMHPGAMRVTMGRVRVRGTCFIESSRTFQENIIVYTLRRNPCYVHIATHSQSLPETLVLRRLSVIPVFDIPPVNYNQEVQVHDGLIDEVIVELSYLLCVFNITTNVSTSGKKNPRPSYQVYATPKPSTKGPSPRGTAHSVTIYPNFSPTPRSRKTRTTVPTFLTTSKLIKERQS